MADLNINIELRDFEDSNEMVSWFFNRTIHHITLVREYCQKIHDKFPQLEGILDLAATHDASKLREPEILPYIILTWQYKCKDDEVEFEVPEEIENYIHAATEHHVKTNSHHAEFYAPPADFDLINKEDRDQPPEHIVDAHLMPDLAIAEMVADWCAMAEERGTLPQQWAKDNIGKRWSFTKEQEALIYELIEAIWEV